MKYAFAFGLGPSVVIAIEFNFTAAALHHQDLIFTQRVACSQKKQATLCNPSIDNRPDLSRQKNSPQKFPVDAQYFHLFSFCATAGLIIEGALP
jgi:hypothetical protein